MTTTLIPKIGAVGTLAQFNSAVTALVDPASGQNVLSFAPRTSPVKVAVFGDSTADWGQAVSPDQQDTTVATAPFPASSTTVINYLNIDKGNANYFYPMAHTIGDFGISGETTTQMLARDQAAAGITRRAVADMIDLKPDVAIMRCGSINDVLALTAASSQADIDAIYTRHVELLNRASTGIDRLIDEGIFGYAPSSGVAADIAFRKAAIASLNTRFATNAAASNGRIVFINPEGILSVAGEYIAGVYESTGVHLNMLGAYLIGQEEKEVFQNLFGPSAPYRFAGVNIFPNPLFAKTSAQAYGTAADNLTYGASSSTRQNAKIETIDGKQFATVEHVMTGADPYGSFYVDYDPSTMSISANDVYGFECDFLIATLDGTPVPAPSSRTIAQVVTQKTALGSVTVTLMNAAYTRPTMTEDQLIYHLSVPFKFQEASAALANAGSDFFVQFGTAVNGTYKIGISNPRIVKLGVAQATS